MQKDLHSIWLGLPFVAALFLVFGTIGVIVYLLGFWAIAVLGLTCSAWCFGEARKSAKKR